MGNFESFPLAGSVEAEIGKYPPIDLHPHHLLHQSLPVRAVPR